uniref:Uncharacterized protein n=1 Tax=Anguilla anguilla TaxID=7936 RepID=A0A0E9X8S8_ANGAN
MNQKDYGIKNFMCKYVINPTKILTFSLLLCKRLYFPNKLWNLKTSGWMFKV